MGKVWSVSYIQTASAEKKFNISIFSSSKLGSGPRAD